MSGIYISAAHKSSGKTTVSLGICAALSRTGSGIQPFKKGPDYIDPAWLSLAADRACFNLDFYTSSREEIRALYGAKMSATDISIVEGNKGLYDGMDLEGSDSNAALARLLDLPIVLVIDTMGMTRGIAPLLLGYANFDRSLNLAGVILNRVGGPRHESKLVESVERYTEVRVLGSIPRFRSGEIEERHLGLIPVNEDRAAATTINMLADVVSANVDLEALRNIATKAGKVPAPPRRIAINRYPLKIGIARDAAFGFYYADDLEAFREMGADIVWVDMINDVELPHLDGLFIGGGFPETSLRGLEANSSMKTSVLAAIESGLPCYAECGGLMYLSRSIEWQNRTAAMVGVIPGKITMSSRPHGRGYIRLRETADMPWPDAPIGEVAGHEFHYSQLEGLPEGSKFAYEVVRGTGIQENRDGYCYKNLVASYAHLRNMKQNRWVERFLKFSSQVRAERLLAQAGNDS